MNTRRKNGLVRLLNGVTAAGAGSAIDVSDYKNIILQVYTSGNTIATIKFAVSYKTTKPDFTSGASATNVYDYVQILPLNAQTALTGSTGIALSGTDVIKNYQVQGNLIKWLCPIVSGYSAGTITVELDASTD